jgi:YggT family protein
VIQIIFWLINFVIQIITLLVIMQVFISYFLSPYHPLRLNVDRIVEPMLRPIRKIVPPVGMLDFSPLVLLILVQLAGKIIVTLLTPLGK